MVLQGSTTNSNIGTSIGIVVAIFAVFGLAGFLVFRRYRNNVHNYLQRGVYDVDESNDNDDDDNDDDGNDNGASDKNGDDEGSPVWSLESLDLYEKVPEYYGMDFQHSGITIASLN